MGIDLNLLTNRAKAKLVDALKEIHAVSELLTELDLARSSCFYHRAQRRGYEYLGREFFVGLTANF